MMDPKTLAIPLAFILLSALLCWHLISAKGKWGVKLALIILVPSFGLMVWRSLSSYQGWPTAAQTPEKALFLQGVVREPEQNESDPGAIYLWLLPLSEEVNDVESFLAYKAFRGEPRAYKLPYTREMHQAVNKAKAMAAEGKPVVMQRGAKPGAEGDGEGEGEPGEGEPGEEGLEGRPARPGGRPGDGYGGHEQDVQIYELPAPAFPRKDSE